MHSFICCLAAVVLTVSPAIGATIVVQPGDTLSLIAKRTLGDPNKWVELCALNQPQLKRCNILTIGSELKISPDEIKIAQPELPGLVNVLEASTSFADSYWEGYWQKPATSEGVSDPFGGTKATRVESADKADNPGQNASGFFHREGLQAGTYEIEVWLRSTKGVLNFYIGLEDSAMIPNAVPVDEKWQKVVATISTSQPIGRRFQVIERTKENPAWEIYGAKVIKQPEAE